MVRMNRWKNVNEFLLEAHSRLDPFKEMDVASGFERNLIRIRAVQGQRNGSFSSRETISVG